jgi:hypothetical protein
MDDFSVFFEAPSGELAVTVRGSAEMRVENVIRPVLRALKLSDVNPDDYRIYRQATSTYVEKSVTFQALGILPNERFTLVPKGQLTIADFMPLSPIRGQVSEEFIEDSAPIQAVKLGPIEELESTKAPLYKTEEFHISAPVRIPERAQLTVDLIPASTIYRLEEYRADQMRAEAIMWTFIGAVIGLITSWALQESISFSRPSLIILAFLVGLAIISGVVSTNFKRRADNAKGEMFKFRESNTKSSKPGKWERIG